jgi:hypothetical protein
VRVIIAGCRWLRDPGVVARAVAGSRFRDRILAVRTGGQETREAGRPVGGADWLAARWAESQGVPVEVFPAAWEDLAAPGAVPFRRRDGTLCNLRAGPDRNARMLDTEPLPDGLLALWDGASRGTADVIHQAFGRRAAGRPLHVHVHWVGKAPPRALAWLMALSGGREAGRGP